MFVHFCLGSSGIFPKERIRNSNKTKLDIVRHLLAKSCININYFFFPIVVVANKSDLAVDTDLPHESLEATAIFDWENGYVECSAKDRININKIFKELLIQTKSR